MSNEIFEINNVKQEFLQNIGPEYTQVFSERQLEMSIYMLNEFCTALANNGLVLLRIEPEPTPYRAPPTPQMGIPPQYEQQGYRMPAADPFQEQQLHQQQMVQQQVKEMNAQLPRAPPRPQPSQPKSEPVQEVDLSADKPKTFAEKIREMRAGTKNPNRINPDDNQY